jgi:hypothetical protein
MSEMTEVAPGVFKKNDSMFMLRCNITGELSYANKERMKGLLIKYGSYEEIGKQYQSRAGLSSLKEKKVKKDPGIDVSLDSPDSTVESIESIESPDKEIEEGKEDHVYYGDRFSHFNITPSDKKVYDACTTDLNCLRPCLFRKNDGYCNGCNWFSICQIDYKKIGTPRAVRRDDCIDKTVGTIEMLTELESRDNANKCL